MKENPISFQMKLNPDDFLPATNEEKESLVVMRESVSFWKDGFRRLRKNKVAMVSLVVIILIMILSFIVPSFYPYSYKTQIMVQIIWLRCSILLMSWQESMQERAYSLIFLVQTRWDVIMRSVL